MKSFKIGREIYQILTQNQSIGSIVFPLVATPDTNFPFIIYRRINYNPENSNNTRCIHPENRNRYLLKLKITYYG